MRSVVLIALALMLCGCGHREAAKSAEQARQADAAVAADVIKALAESLDIEGWKSRARVWLDLVQQSERSTSVVVAALSPDAPPRVTTSEQMAVAQPAQFVSEAQKQVGRTEAENADNAQWTSVAGILGTYAAALAGGNWVSILLTAVGGAGGAGAIIAGAMKAMSALRKRDDALADAVKTGDELADAKTPTEVKAVKDAAKARQRAKGIHPLIEKALSKKA